jgi:hypothetical protein
MPEDFRPKRMVQGIEGIREQNLRSCGWPQPHDSVAAATRLDARTRCRTLASD